MTRLAVWIAVAAVVVAYPISSLVAGGPHFPTRDECVRPAVGDGEIDAVFGYFASPREAAKVRDSALAVGFVGTDVVWDACGRLRVHVGGIPSLEVGRELAKEARSVGLDVTLEQAG